MDSPYLTIESPTAAPGVHMITMRRAPENKMNIAFAQDLVLALRYIETKLLKPGAPGAVVLSSFSDKFWCTGIELDEAVKNPYTSADGFVPLVAALLDYPYPTVAMLTGHTFGASCLVALACDYRVMNSERGYFSMPPVNLGLHFEGMGLLPRLKVGPRTSRRMLLEAHRWKGPEALQDGIVDAIAEPAQMRLKAIEIANELAPRAAKEVYGLLRVELWGDALKAFRAISHVHRKRIDREPRL